MIKEACRSKTLGPCHYAGQIKHCLVVITTIATAATITADTIFVPIPSRWETVEQPLVMMAGKHFCSRLRWALISQTTSSVKISLTTGLSHTEGPTLCTPRHLSIPLLDRVKVLHCIQPIALAKMFTSLCLIFLIYTWGVVKYLLHRNSMRMSYYMYISWNSACRHSIGKY